MANPLIKSAGITLNNTFKKIGTLQIKDLLDDQCSFLNQTVINKKYKINISFLYIMSIIACIQNKIETNF